MLNLKETAPCGAVEGRSAMSKAIAAVVIGVGFVILAGGANAASHREAPFITEQPKVDGTDFYMFRSYETGREAFVTMVADYMPLQDAYGGPNYFALDSNGLYEIHIDNNGDAKEDKASADRSMAAAAGRAKVSARRKRSARRVKERSPGRRRVQAAPGPGDARSRR